MLLDFIIALGGDDGQTVVFEHDPRNPSRNREMKMEKTREATPGTLPETKRTEEMMMEQNARIPGTKKSWWKKTVSWKSWEPHSTPEPFGQQAPEPQPEPWNDDGTGCQKSIGRQAPEP